MARYWEKGSGGVGLEVHCLVLFGSRTAGLDQHESQFWGVFFFFFCC